MERYTINNLKEFLIDGTDEENNNIDNTCAWILGNYERKLNENFSSAPYTDIKLRKELVLECDSNHTALRFDPNAIIKPLCEILNVDYIELEDDSKYEYYMARFEEQITALKKIQSEEELTYHFPELARKYRIEAEGVEKIREIIYSTARIFPSKEREKVRLIRNKNAGYEYKDYQRFTALMTTFSLDKFIYDAVCSTTLLVANLPFIIENISNTAVNIQNDVSVDQAKIAAFIESQRKKELMRK